MDNSIKDGVELIAKTECSEELYGYKIGSLWILDTGIQILKDLKNTILKDSNKKLILDMQKWGTDIPDIVTKQVNKVAPYVDELIVCPMGGGRQSLKAFSVACTKNNIKPICVIEMTHPESESYLELNYWMNIYKDAIEFGINSFVIPSTKNPKIIKRPDVELYATGFKTQGGQTKLMKEAGVSKYIVGRGVYESPDPIKSIQDIYKEINGV